VTNGPSGEEGSEASFPKLKGGKAARCRLADNPCSRGLYAVKGPLTGSAATDHAKAFTRLTDAMPSAPREVLMLGAPLLS
jgi:hypothetical protein